MFTNNKKETIVKLQERQFLPFSSHSMVFFIIRCFKKSTYQLTKDPFDELSCIIINSFVFLNKKINELKKSITVQKILKYLVLGIMIAFKLIFFLFYTFSGHSCHSFLVANQ